ncbi:MAG: response regulator [Deltaproteobacteria bacterium]|nr:response regulator [Deltaproteobacteria bacterium]
MPEKQASESQEQARLAALDRYCIMDTPEESTFDLITTTVSEMLGVPFACISLVGRDRVWFKSRVGVEDTEVEREPGFCSTLVNSDVEVLHFDDAAKCVATRDNSLVREAGIRFYVGVPLEDPEGLRIGTLCAFGPTSRGLTESERRFMLNFGNLVMNEIELRRARRELQRTEIALKSAQRLESIGLVASGVAHDFNNLLGGIIGNAGLLRLHLQTDGEAQELLSEIENTSRRAVDLVGQVLTFAGRGEDSPMEATDFNRLVRETCRMLENSMRIRSRVEFDLQPDLPQVLGQSTGLRQVVMNLLTNASEASSQESSAQGPGEKATGAQVAAQTRGTVRLKTQLGSDGKILFSVSDDGMGIGEESLARLFEPFFSSKSGGRGLGLAISDRIVKQHGGSIEVKSKVGQGTTFFIELPICKVGPKTTLDATPPKPTPKGRGVILVVDDEPSVRMVAGRCLELAGYQTILANSGEQALEILSDPQCPAVAVLLDWTMPGLGGREVLEALRERGQTLPVIISSGHSEQDILDRAAGLSGGLFLKKPYTPRELAEKVGVVLSAAHEAPATLH